MFDDLDDPAFPGARPGAREAVAGRAKRIKRNRTIAMVSGMSSLVLVSAVLTAAVASGGGGGDSLEPVTSGSPTAAASPTPSETPSPSESPTATRTSGSVAQPSPVAPPTASARGRDLVWEWLRDHYADTCRPATSLRPGITNSASLDLRLEVPDVVDADDPGMAKLTITNISDSGTWFQFLGVHRGPLHTLATDDKGTFTGVTTYNGVVGRISEGGRDDVRGANLAPGESQVELVPILLDRCDPQRDRANPGEPRPLAPGTYRMAVTIEIVDSMDWDPRATQEPTESPTGSPSPSPSSTAYEPARISSDVVTVTVR
jgi:hypothetical protein